MIAIITEKPSVAYEIARVIGATIKKEGCITGNNYIVTWALGHLVSLAMPDYYGYGPPSAANLPIIPNPFRFTVRQRKTHEGTEADPVAVKQLSIIDRAFKKCESIIVATDAGREGELIFRYIYYLLGCTKPFRRLWISSLTDKAISKGFSALKDGHEYDSLYSAANCRAAADWLVGINASRALAVVTGMHNNSLGRVQTPTLSMICSRYYENKNFQPTDYWQLHIILSKDGRHRDFHYTEDFIDKETAGRIYESVKDISHAVITKFERRKIYEEPPLLYDLTSLQKDCSTYLDLSARETLSIAQKLYENKLITYPRTGSRFIPEDMGEQIPELLHKAATMHEFSDHITAFNPENLPRRCIDSSKVTDHHALLITNLDPAGLNQREREVYVMIAGRLLESFSSECEKEVTLVEAAVSDKLFRSHSQRILFPGWREVRNRNEKEKGESMQQNEELGEFEQAETVPVSDCNLEMRKTTPKPFHTEASILTAMETARQTASKDKTNGPIQSGIGTPATRAVVLSTLFTRHYIQRSGKSIIPTEKGLAVYNAVKDMLVSNVEMTASWESSLSQIERRSLMTDTFMESIIKYTRQLTKEILNSKVTIQGEKQMLCPKCGGRILLKQKVAKCKNEHCGLIIFRQFLNKELTDEHLEQLFYSGSTKLIKGFRNKEGKSFDAALIFDKNFHLSFSFPKKKSLQQNKTGRS